MKSTWKRLLSIVMALCLLASIVPMTVLAVEGDAADSAVTETEAAEPVAEESVADEETTVLEGVSGSIDGGYWHNPLYPDLGTPAVKYNAGEMIQGNLVPEDFKSRDYVPQILRQALVERKTEIYLYYSSLTPVTEEECLSIMEEALAETGVYNEGDYLVNSLLEYGFGADYILDGITYYNVVVYEVSYLTSAQEEEALSEIFYVLKDTLLDGADTPYQKHKAIYDYILANVDYDRDNAGNVDYLTQHSAYSALVKGKASVQGYAMLYYYMANYFNLPCRIVYGTLADTEVLSPWNIVQIYDKWYNVDAAFDDLSSTNEFFIKGTEDFLEHTRTGYYDTPEYHAAHPMAAKAYDAEHAAGGDVGEIHWNYNELTNELTISGSGEMPDFETVYYSNGENFESCSAPWWPHLKESAVIIEEGITTIGANAFHKASVGSVSLPKSLTKIGEKAFYEAGLDAITLPEKLEVIGKGAFERCYGIKSVALPEALTIIDDNAFYLTGIDKITLPKNVSFVGKNAFVHSDSSIGFIAYYVDEANPRYTAVSGLLMSKDKTVLESVPGGVSQTEFVMPETVTAIGRGAFTGCTDWTVVEIPERITRIEDYAFEGTTVKELILHDGITYIGVGAFANMQNLKGIALPKGITEIPAELFRQTPLRCLIIPDGVTSIGEYAFEGCRYLVSIYMPLAVKSVGAHAFMDTYALNYVNYEGSAEQWQQITIGEDNLFLGRWGQYYNSKKIVGTTGEKNDLCWTLDLTSGELVISKGIINYAITTANDYAWHPYRDRIVSVHITTEDSTGREIGRNMFADCVNLKRVTFEPSPYVWNTSIYDYAFEGCTSLESISLPPNTSLNSYGNGGMFKGCTALKQVVFEGNDLSYLACYAFEGCTALKTITLPSVMIEYGEGAFKDCTALETVEYAGNSLTTLSAKVFEGCTALKEFTIPASVTQIGDNAFAGCDNLEQVNYKGVEKQWGEVNIGTGNEALTNANISFNVCDNHVWDGGTVTKEPTVEEEGERVRTCTVCGQTKTETVNRLPDPSYVNPFTDVADTDWFYAPVQWAVTNNITGGLGDGMFGPNASCTRGQVVTFLWAAAGRPEPTSTDNPFTDVSASDYFFKPVLWAVENNITGGLGEGIFGPHETCTRGQIVTFLWASQGKPAVSSSSAFIDVADSDWYAKPVIWADENEVTGGIGPGQFGPNNTCTRGQVVTFLYKVYQ